MFSKYVLEHLDDPVRVFRELRRVTKPGGRLIVHAPNRFHYYALAARITPHRFHVWFNDKRGQDEEDAFETRYRANDRFLCDGSQQPADGGSSNWTSSRRNPGTSSSTRSRIKLGSSMNEP